MKTKQTAAPRNQPPPLIIEAHSLSLSSCSASFVSYIPTRTSHRSIHRDPPHVPRPPTSSHPHLKHIRPQHERDVPSWLLRVIDAGFRQQRYGIALDLHRVWRLPSSIGARIGSVPVLRGSGCGAWFGFEVYCEDDARFLPPEPERPCAKTCEAALADWDASAGRVGYENQAGDGRWVRND